MPGFTMMPYLWNIWISCENFCTRLNGLFVSSRQSSSSDSIPTNTDTQPLSAASLTISSSSPRNSVDWQPHLILRGLRAVHSSRQYVRLLLCRSSTNATMLPSSMPIRIFSVERKARHSGSSRMRSTNSLRTHRCTYFNSATTSSTGRRLVVLPLNGETLQNSQSKWQPLVVKLHWRVIYASGLSNSTLGLLYCSREGKADIL